MSQVIECVPNFSEGRNPDVIQALVALVRSVPGVALLDESHDTDHHRSVVTFAGRPYAVAEVAFQMARLASQLIDLRSHHGEHPRVGATDVMPFVPIREVSMQDCVQLARMVGQRIGNELKIPVFLYEQAAARPERVQARPSAASSMTRARAPVMRSGRAAVICSPSTNGSGSKAAGARRSMRATMPGADSV